MAQFFSNYAIVEKGDWLGLIANHFGTTDDYLASLNKIKDKRMIYIGQSVAANQAAVDAGHSSTAAPGTNTVKSNRPVIVQFGRQAGGEGEQDPDRVRDMFVTWKWDKANTENFTVEWYYSTGVGVMFLGATHTVTKTDGYTIDQDTYTAPSNANAVRVRIKANAKTHDVNGTQTPYWTGDWSEHKIERFDGDPPQTPSSAPSTSVEGYEITVSMSNIPTIADSAQVQLYRNESGTPQLYKTSGKLPVSQLSTATYTVKVEGGYTYYARYRLGRGDAYSNYSPASSDIVIGPGSAPSIISCKAATNNAVSFEWTKVENAEYYEFQYTDHKEYFDGSDAIQSFTTESADDPDATTYIKTGFDQGKEYFFRMRAVNDGGHSDWSEIKSTVVGSAPTIPTTWSSSTAVKIGDPLDLYWVHNSRDGSSQTYGQIEMTVNGTVQPIITVQNTDDEYEKDKTSVYHIDTTDYPNGAEIEWRVRTAGVLKDASGNPEYGNWSIKRVINIYEDPVLRIVLKNGSGTAIETVTAFPFRIFASVGASGNQTPIGYSVSVVSQSSYEALDKTGTKKIVSVGDEIYSTVANVTETSMFVQMTPDVIDLENGMNYTACVQVTMDSGLLANETLDFTVNWQDLEYDPNAEISIDPESVTAIIRPYCEDENGNLISGVTLAVYRREYDGRYVEIGSKLANTKHTFITDPHPSLDFARYRIVATVQNTGAISFYDVPGYPVNEKAAIIQWDEAWTDFNAGNGDELAEQPWSGSMLKIPYNIDISDSYSGDVSLVEYIGRPHPVSYYGTQLGFASNWNMEIPKYDKDTLYAIRRLSIWMGDVYVREPSGSGYWAKISVSYNQNHLELTIPITFQVTRVEGGV